MRKKIFHLFLVLQIFTSASFTWAAPFTLFSEDEIEKLAYPEDEWAQELDNYREHRAVPDDEWVDELSSGKKGSDNMLLPGNERTSKGFGPIVRVINPVSAGDHYKATIPVELLIFLKSRKSPIDLDSLTVKGKRGIFSLNITQRIKAFLRQPLQTENADYVIDARIPKLSAGRYLIVLSLADIDGNREEQSAFLEVVNND